MKRTRTGVYYATRQAARMLFVGGLLLALAAYLNWGLEHVFAALIIGAVQTIVIAGVLWFHWGERGIALIRRQR